MTRAGADNHDHIRAATLRRWCVLFVGATLSSGSVRLCKIKRPAGVFWFDLQQLRQDSDGTWLWGLVGRRSR